MDEGTQHHCPPANQTGAGEGFNLGQFTETVSVQGGLVRQFTYESDQRQFDVSSFFEGLRDNIQSILSQSLDHMDSIRVQFTLRIYMINEQTDMVIYPAFNSEFMILSSNDGFEDILLQAVAYLIEQLNLFNARGSGFTILTIDKLHINVAPFPTLRASGYIKTPAELKGRQSLLNMKSFGDTCFVWAVLACLHHREVPKNKRRKWTSYEKFYCKYNWDMCTFPLHPRDIGQWEDVNHVSVSVYVNKGSDIYPMRTPKTVYEKHVDLLYVSNERTAHFISILDISKFLGRHHINRHYMCRICLRKFRSESVWKQHEQKCTNEDETEFVLSSPDQNGRPTYLEFTGYHKLLRAEFLCFSDFETAIETRADGTKQHVPIAYGLAMTTPEGGYLYKDHFGYGAEVVEHFFKTVLGLADFAIHYMKQDKGLPDLTVEEQKRFDSATICMLCNKLFDNTPARRKSRHHQHSYSSSIVGPFLGAACNSCNIKTFDERKIIVFFHGGRKFDFQLLLSGLKSPLIETVQVIPSNTEQVISLEVNKKVIFLDTMSKLGGSLQKVTEMTRKSNGIDAFRFTKKAFADYAQHLEKIVKKQLLPYDYITSWDRLMEPNLPPPSAFKNSLTEEEVTLEQWKEAKEMFDLFQCRNILEYERIYLKLDVMLLLGKLFNVMPVNTSVQVLNA